MITQQKGYVNASPDEYVTLMSDDAGKTAYEEGLTGDGSHTLCT